MAAAAAVAAAPVSNPTFPSSSKSTPNLPFLSFSPNLRMPTTRLIKSALTKRLLSPSSLTPIRASTTSSPTTSPTPATAFHGLCYVLGDNIDTDQIIPAEHLTLVPSNPDEYRKLGSFAFIGLPSTYPIRFIEPGEFQSKYTIIIGGENFGCGSSREHAPVALGASGVKAVVAESYARIFFRNSIATGEVYPLESEVRLCEECSTGDVITIELAERKLTNHTTGKVYELKPIGDAGPVIEAGGIFAYARKTGLIPSSVPSS